MSLSVNSVNSMNVHSLGNTENVGQIPANTNLLKGDAPTDTVNFKGKERTEAESKEIVRKARTTAAGWSIFGGIFSTLYYGLRSDNTVAEKYDLDPKADKKLIKQIKKDQTLCTLPSAIFYTIIPGLVTYLYCNNMDADKIDLD